MFNSKISLEQFTNSVMETVSSANLRMRESYIEAVREAKSEICTLPSPLTIKNARISFEANISKQNDRQSAQTLMLDFSKPTGNFRGEFTLDAFEAFEEETEENCGGESTGSSEPDAPPPPYCAGTDCVRPHADAASPQRQII